MNGVVYIAYGDQAKREVEASIKSLNCHNMLPVTIITERQFDEDQFRTNEQKSRLAKVKLPELIDYERVLYLDADTRVNGDITPGFEMLDNWDLVIVPSKNQGNELFRHIGNSDEKEETLHELGNCQPLQLQAGVMFFHRQRCMALFTEWERQWRRWQGQDQAALLRALAIEPVRIWVLGRDWNSEKGKLITHLFGRI